jgi:hypothetical protein
VSYWTPGTATGIGSLPGIDPREAARTVAGELPGLPHLAELPARGVGADIIGRTAGLLVDLAVELVPSGYRVTARPGREHRRAVDLLRTDLDAFEEALDATHPEWVKVQSAGPWTLATHVELRNGHRVLTDHGARREFAASLAEGLARHAAEVATRTGARVAVQLDEPSLPSVLAGALPTPSGFGTVASVPEPDAEDLLRAVIEALPAPVIVHCCAPKAPIGLLRPRPGRHPDRLARQCPRRPRRDLGRRGAGPARPGPQHPPRRRPTPAARAGPPRPGPGRPGRLRPPTPP